MSADPSGVSQHSLNMQRLIESSELSDDRLPMLDVVFDRLSRLLTTSLRHFSGDNADVSIDAVSCVRFGDYLGRVQSPSLLAVFRADEWDNQGLIVFDGPLVFSIIDVLLGGCRGTAAMRTANRPFTTIERALITKLIHLILADLSASFAPISAVNFSFERLEVSPRFASIARPTNAVMQGRLRIDLDDRGGMLEILLPNATLEPIREMLIQQFMGERFGRDHMWEAHLAQQIRTTEVTLDVVLDEQSVNLSEVLNLAVGSSLILRTHTNDSVDVRCGNHSLFRAKVGRKKESVAVQIESIVQALHTDLFFTKEQDRSL